MNSILTRDTLHAQAKSLKDPEKRQIALNEYKKYNNTLTISIRKAKQLYYTNSIEKAKGDMKTTWKTIDKSVGELPSLQV